MTPGDVTNTENSNDFIKSYARIEMGIIAKCQCGSAIILPGYTVFTNAATFVLFITLGNERSGEIWLR